MSLGCVYQDGLCSRLTEKAKSKRLNERDLSLPMSISSNFSPGIDLNTVLFDREGYYENTTNGLLEVLDSGLRRIYLDVYYDRQFSKWHSCPYRPSSVGTSTTLVNNQTTTFGTTLTAYPTEAPATLDVNTAAIATNTELYDDGMTALINNKRGTTQTETVSNTGDTSYGSGFFSTNSSFNVPCDYVSDLALFVEKLNGYSDLSDTNIAAGLVYLHLRPKFWADPPDGQKATPYTFGQPNINATFNPVAKRISTPVKNTRSPKKAKKSQTATLSASTRKKGKSSTQSVYPHNPYTGNTDSDSDDEEDNFNGMEWPTSRSLSYTETDRLVVSYTPRLVSQIPDLAQLSDIAFALVPTIEQPQNYSVDELANLNFTDTFVSDETSWNQATLAGVSPVLKETSFGIFSDEMLSLSDNHGNWAWSTGQPILYTEEAREEELKEVGTKRPTELAACAVFTNSGLAVANCYAHFPVLCKNKSNESDWRLSDDNHTYFSSSCPKNYKFGVPQSPLESRWIRENLINGSDSPWYAWVDFNSLFLPNCWVSGGTEAVCPYNVVENNRNGIGFIAAAGAVAAVIGLVTILFELDRRRSPSLRNYRKRNVTQANEFEGIPS